MVKSKTKIEKQTQRKLNPELVETIRLAKKNRAWLDVASILSSPRKNKVEYNLNKINSVKDDVVVPGKVLSQGEIGKKKIVAFNFSEKAKEKIIKAGGKAINILDEIKQNKEMKNLIVLK